jgi:hypothetical protein
VKDVPTITEETKVELDALLMTIRKRFYSAQPEKRFHQDKAMLQKAVTWPATWLRARGVAWTSKRYFQVIEDKLGEVQRHGATAADISFFPGYLMKVLQDHFAHNGETYTREGKHVGHSIAYILAGLPPAVARAEREKEKVIDTLAAAHALLASRPKTAKPAQSDNAQLDLL